MRYAGAAAPHGYTPGSGVPCSDPTKGLAQISLMDIAGNPLADQSGTVITSKWMYPDAVTPNVYAYPFQYGMGIVGSFFAVMWGEVIVNGLLQRCHRKISITIDNDGVITAATPTSP
jgi:hypothetical protein